MLLPLTPLLSELVMVASVEASSAFDTHHDDVIHDAQVDFFGRRLATASSDRTIRIFQINQNQTETLMSILSGHEGPVWQVSWAHPKFGSILASCSYDGTVIIWQESKILKTDTTAFALKSPTEEKNGSLWTKAKVHRVHESSVNSISFAPHDFGLHLACASSDGKISILSQSENGEWTSQAFTAHQTGCNSVSWCPSSKASSLLSLNFKSSENDAIEVGEMILASGGCDNFVKIWKFSLEQKQWISEASLPGHTDWVRDVCWRPSIGAVRHLLVSCSQDNTVLLWKKDDKGSWSFKHLKPEPFADTIWRASFSEYGHLLAVSCGDNTVTIWREVPQTGDWEQVGTVDENVTEAVKISEPLAVQLPESTPVPDLSYRQSEVTNEQYTEPAPIPFESYNPPAEFSYDPATEDSDLNTNSVAENFNNPNSSAPATDTFYGQASAGANDNYNGETTNQLNDNYYGEMAGQADYNYYGETSTQSLQTNSAENYTLETTQPTQAINDDYGVEPPVGQSSNFQPVQTYYENPSFQTVDTQYQANYNYDPATPSTEAAQTQVSEGKFAPETCDYSYSNQNEYMAHEGGIGENVTNEFNYSNYAQDPQFEQQAYSSQTEDQYNQYEQPLQYQTEEQLSNNYYQNSGPSETANYPSDYNQSQPGNQGL